MKVVRVTRVTRNSAGVVTDTGLRVRVPRELGFIGAVLDEDRVHARGGWNIYLAEDSGVLKKRRALKGVATLPGWAVKEFHHLVWCCAVHYARKGWLRRFDVKDVVDDYMGYAYCAGTPVKMVERPEAKRGIYVWACMRGWLVNGYSARKGEAKKTVSLEYLQELCGDAWETRLA